jgi:hypothetical protein
MELDKINHDQAYTEINKLQSMLYTKAREYNFNLQHPEIQQISRELDDWIVQVLKEKAKGSL